MNKRGPSVSTIMRTTHVRAVDVEERWFLYDASDHILGRMAAKIAFQLIGKDRPTYTPSEPGATHVVVINAGAVRVTGNKDEAKTYKRYTGYPSGQRLIPIEKMREKNPIEIITLAVRRMLPKNRLGHTMLKSLKVYGGSDHPHSAQAPVLQASTTPKPADNG